HHTLAFEQQDRQEQELGQDRSRREMIATKSWRIDRDRRRKRGDQEENSQSLEQVGVVVGDEHAIDDAPHDAQLHYIQYGEHLVLQGQDHFAVDVVQEASQDYVDFSRLDAQQTGLVEGKWVELKEA
ncbi:uncharacterized protein EDB91DRAFT_1087412, partial [Suillus paluster]|uniref:uncharacterized protein n=1 Tax=Suillus paluster TaxID=48578 RepID=UPI001B86F453